jgi:hypothetical protein
MEIIALLLTPSVCALILRCDFINFSTEKLRSHEADVTDMVNAIRYTIQSFGRAHSKSIANSNAICSELDVGPLDRWSRPSWTVSASFLSFCRIDSGRFILLDSLCKKSISSSNSFVNKSGLLLFCKICIEIS